MSGRWALSLSLRELLESAGMGAVGGAVFGGIGSAAGTLERGRSEAPWLLDHAPETRSRAAETPDPRTRAGLWTV